MSHVPDLTKMPKPLQCLKWQENEKDLTWENGQTLLVAIPIYDNSKSDNWHYEFDVIQVDCDENYGYVLSSCGDPWVWDIDDFDWFVTIGA